MWKGRGTGNQDLWDLREEWVLVLRAGDWCSHTLNSVPVSLWLSDLGIRFEEELSLVEAVNAETI